MVSRPSGIRDVAMLPRRGVVERTCGWLGCCRRRSQDYEARPTARPYGNLDPVGPDLTLPHRL